MATAAHLKTSLDPLFWPQAIAIIGASTKELSIGNVIIKNLQEYGYRGKIYPINPKAPEVRGLKAYASVDEIPGPVDLAHIIIPAPLVPQTIEVCGKKGIKAVIINSAGFSEMGKEGAKLQESFLANARKFGVRVFGPNCQGIINTDPTLKAYCDFTFTRPDPGNISVVALSGGVGALIMQALFDLGVGMRMYASNGNAADVSIPEVLRYWGDDEGTRVIVLYTEGFRDPKEFLEAAKVVAAKKPILAMKAARTEQGAKAASSHTGSLAGVDISTELIFKKTGVLPFIDEGEMVRAAMAFSTQPIPRGKRVGLITNTGGPAVVATDVLVAGGLQVPKLSEKAIARLKATQLPEAALENPVDVVATAGAPQFRAALEVMLEEDGIDSIYMTFVTAPFTDVQAVAREIAAISGRRSKPIVCNFMTDLSQERFRETLTILNQGGVPCYANPSDAAKALCALVAYGQIRQRNPGNPETFTDVDTLKASSVVQRARQAGRSSLSAEEIYAVFEAYGIPVPPWKVVEGADQAVRTAENIGYPVVIKADAERIDHKSDVKGVVVNLTDAESVRATVTDMQARLQKFGTLKFLVQKYLPGGRELIVGATIKKGLGHLLMFGLGGIYVEVLKDVVFSLAPVTRVEAREMIGAIKTSTVLDGLRGEKGVDKEAVGRLIQRVSTLVTQLPMIQELDLNPIMAFPDGVFAIDGRIRI